MENVAFSVNLTNDLTHKFNPYHYIYIYIYIYIYVCVCVCVCYILYYIVGPV